MEAFIEQQDERVAYSRQLMDEAERELLRQALGDKARDKHADHDKVEIKAELLPLRRLKYMDVLRFMVVALSGRDVIFVLMAFMSVAVLGMLTPYVTRQFMDEMIPSGHGDMLVPLGCLLVSATLGTMLFTITRTLVIMRVRDKMDIRINAGIINRVYHLPTSFFKEWTSGDLGHRIVSASQILSQLAEKGITMMLSMVFAAMYFCQIGAYAPSLLIVSMGSFVAQTALMSVFLWLAQRERTRINVYKNKVSGMLYSVISGMPRIKSSGAEERAFAKWAMLYANMLTDRVGRNAFLVYYPALTAFITLATTVAAYYYTITTDVSLSDYIAYAAAFGLVTSAITALAGLLPELTQLKPAMDQCRPIMDAVPEVASETAEKPATLSGAIEINGLRFRYDAAQEYVFNDLNLRIEPGEYVAIVGRSGCGKSTLVRLLLGFEKAESGSIFYDSYSIDTVDLGALRQRIGTCLQDGRLFEGDIFSNIIVTAPLSTQEDVWEAARIACVDEDIKSMGMGLHTRISDNGRGISGGQSQRVLIARALVGRPSILIFDEATSALDNITQSRVAENLDALRCTRICIAHRLSTIRNCSRIIVIDRGRVAEEGTFEQLMQQQGLFYELAKRQMA